MKISSNLVRILLLSLLGFIALTAIAGGALILLGVDSFPLEWLEGTPFDSYTVPALLLSFIVGGSSLVAFVMELNSSPGAVIASLLAASILVIFVVVEVLILEQEPPGPTIIEIFYLVLAVLTILVSYFQYNHVSES